MQELDREARNNLGDSDGRECGFCDAVLGDSPLEIAVNAFPPGRVANGARRGIGAIVSAVRGGRAAGRAVREGRRAYVQQAAAIRDAGFEQIRRGVDPEIAARQAYEARKVLKVRIRDSLPTPFKRAAELRDRLKYGNSTGQTWQQARALKTPEQIIGSAGKTNERLNSLLGLQ